MSSPSTPRPGETLFCEVVQQRRVLAFAAAHDRREYLEPGAVGEVAQAVDDLLGALAGDDRPQLGQWGWPIRAYSSRR